MTTSTQMNFGDGPRPRFGALAWSLFWCLQLTLGAVGPVQAQRREAEPEAAPSFGGETSASDSGGPIGDQEPAPRRPMRIGAQTPPPRSPQAPSDPLDTRIVVRVKNAPLSTFLDTISAQAQVNFIITEGLETKRVTAFLQNVAVREALQILLEIKGMTYQRIGRSNTYVVSPRAKGVPNRITRIYSLNYIPFNSESGGQAGSTKPAGGAKAGGAAGKGADAGDAGKGVAVVEVIQNVLTKLYGKISIDGRTNSLIITDIPEVFPQIEQILDELDKKAPQVMIEAQIVEINSDRAQQLGLEWGSSTGQLGKFTSGKRDTLFPLNMPKNISRGRFFDPIGSVTSGLTGAVIAEPLAEGAVAPTGTGAAPISAVQTGVLDLTALTVVLRALVTRAEARFLGKPKILTLNNMPAVIAVSKQQAVALEQTSTQDAGGSSSGSSAERYQTGLQLEVTPQVNDEGYVMMLVVPRFTNVVESKVSSLAAPVFDPVTRGASTLVRIKNGQTLVLGGLLESRETKAVRKVPFLGYIPLIGWLFTSQSNQRTNTDLVIFITPTIIRD